MAEHALSSSPSRGLGAFFKTLKRDETTLRRPKIPHMSRSFTGTNAAASSPNDRSEPVSLIINGARVSIPGELCHSPIFGAPLEISIKYASVPISLTDTDGTSFVYGHVPTLVAKCCVFLKKNAKTTSGIFRVPGSVRRIKVLQDEFNSPPAFGKNVNWEGFTQHDVANLLRRYLNTLPEPIVPLAAYSSFREPLQASKRVCEHLDAHAAVLAPAQAPHDAARLREAVELSKPEPAHVEELVAAYEGLILKLPPVNMQLLVYILDLLAVFAGHAAENLMSCYNLSAIFQPNMLHHPQSQTDPDEFKLDRQVLEFLISNASALLARLGSRALQERHLVTASRNGDGDEAPRPLSPSPQQDSQLEKYDQKRLEVTTGPGPHALIANHPGHARRHSKSLSSAQPPQQFHASKAWQTPETQANTLANQTQANTPANQTSIEKTSQERTSEDDRPRLKDIFKLTAPSHGEDPVARGESPLRRFFRKTGVE